MTDRLEETLHFVLRLRRSVAVGVQLGLVVLSNWIAFLLRFDGQLTELARTAFWDMLPWLVVFRALTFVPFRMYRGLWRYTSIYDLRGIMGGVGCSSLLFAAVVQSPFGPAEYPGSIVIIDTLLLFVLLGGIRLSRRVYGELSRRRTGRRVLVYGAGDAGELIVRDMQSRGAGRSIPVGFIDDDCSKVGGLVHGVPILGTRDDLPKILREKRPDEILVAIPGANPETIRAVVKILEPFRITIKTLPSLHEIIDGRVEISQARELRVQDLLPRTQVGLNIEPVKQLIAGRRVMVTGAGGSIGAELCRQILEHHPAQLVLLERSENSLYHLGNELVDSGYTRAVRSVIGDVTNRRHVDETMRAYRPEIVFHAAAHKHVPLMEANPCEAVRNNVYGTRSLIEAAERYRVNRFILISTDKAVNPTSVMGATKRVAELILQTRPYTAGTWYYSVRFGNVLASDGSVIPLFMKQIRRGGPVTVTHPEVRRYFMLISEAVQLVLHAAAEGNASGIYVLEMGGQIPIIDLARNVIRLAGFVPGEEIPGLQQNLWVVSDSGS